MAFNTHLFLYFSNCNNNTAQDNGGCGYVTQSGTASLFQTNVEGNDGLNTFSVGNDAFMEISCNGVDSSYSSGSYSDGML